LHLSRLLLFRPKLAYVLFWHATADGSLFLISNPGCRSFVALPRATNMSPLRGWICVGPSWWSKIQEFATANFHISTFSNFHIIPPFFASFKTATVPSALRLRSGTDLIFLSSVLSVRINPIAFLSMLPRTALFSSFPTRGIAPSSLNPGLLTFNPSGVGFAKVHHRGQEI